MTYLLILLALLVCREARLRAMLRHHQPLGQRSTGPVHTALLRHASLQSSPGSPFPEPREERVLLWRLLGLTLHSRRCSVALPAQWDARIDSVGAEESDALFRGAYRLKEWAAPTPARTTANPRPHPASWYWGSFHFFG